MTEENREKILNAFKERKDIKHFAKLVSNKTIEENNYNIAVSTYVTQKDTREVVDIKKLNKKIAEIIKRQNQLITEIDKIVEGLEE